MGNMVESHEPKESFIDTDFIVRYGLPFNDLKSHIADMTLAGHLIKVLDPKHNGTIIFVPGFSPEEIMTEE